jgi:hypothetical protein
MIWHVDPGDCGRQVDATHMAVQIQCQPRTSLAHPVASALRSVCGKRDGLTETECGQQWSCDDAHPYALFSDARHGCDHHPGRLTLWGFHHPERHRGAWKTCRRCRDGFATEIDVDWGTNDDPFERLENSPAVEPTWGRGGHQRIRLGADSDGRRAGHDVGWSGGEAERPKR